MSSKAKEGSKARKSKIDEIGLPDIEDAFKINYEDLIFKEQIGKGSFGNVYKGDYVGLSVAIKSIHKDMLEQEELERFIQREIAVSKFSHPNLVQFIGFSDTKEGLYLVSEWIPGLDLWKHLKNKGTKLSWNLLAKMAYDTACGMAYLHTRNIIHRDLKCKNLLVGEGYRIKLCDFGFARGVPPGKHRLTICGTEEWMAPEVIMGADYGLKADVFSYGICLLEMITRKKTTVHLAFERTEEELFELDCPAIRKLIPPTAPKSFVDLAFACVEYEDDKRPSFKDIIARLRKVIPECEAFEEKKAREAKAAANAKSGAPPVSKSSQPIPSKFKEPVPALLEEPEVIPMMQVPKKVEPPKEKPAIKKPSPSVSPKTGMSPKKVRPAMRRALSTKKSSGSIIANFNLLKQLKFSNPEALSAKMAELLTPDVLNSWILVEYSGRKSLSLTKCGVTVDELVAELKEDQIQYALLRIPITREDDDRVPMGATVTKTIFINWIGPKVGLVAKGRKASYLAEVMALLSPFHADLTAVAKPRFTEEVVRDRSRPLSGSHVID